MHMNWKTAAVAAGLVLALAAAVLATGGIEAGHGLAIAMAAAPGTTAELIELVNAQHTEVKAHFDKNAQEIAEAKARLTGIEQELVRGPRNGGGGGTGKSVGGEVIASAMFKQYAENGGVGKTRIRVENATLTTDPASAGSLVPGDRSRVGDPIPIQRTRHTIRDLLGKSTTTSSPVYYTKQLGRTNNARIVSEGALKPESAITFELAQTDVKVIATWMPASKQIIADAPRLKSFIDTELTWMVRDEEEQQILFGDGVGENIEGLSTQATAYDNTVIGVVQDHSRIDDLLIGIAQAQQSKIAASGIVVNDLDWARMQAQKDSNGQYIGEGPFGNQLRVAWTLPVVATPAMPQDSFMVGGFDRAVELIDRQLIEILMSDSHEDFFVRNMIAILAEERVALAVKIPEAIVFGDYTNPT